MTFKAPTGEDLLLRRCKRNFVMYLGYLPSPKMIFPTILERHFIRALFAKTRDGE
jgi:hypothetical protein